MRVESGSITIQLGDTDQISAVDNIDELVAWLTVHRPGSLQEPGRTVLEKLKAGRLFRWE